MKCPYYGKCGCPTKVEIIEFLVINDEELDAIRTAYDVRTRLIRTFPTVDLEQANRTLWNLVERDMDM